MKIYHYTNIGSLALILSSKKIRFTRLDMLDDMLESESFPSEAIFFAKRFFVSSWTKDSEENIALWKMYSSVDNGIRITMPIDPFNHYTIKAFAERNHGITKDIISPLTKEEYFYNGKYVINNIFSEKKHDFFKDVVYIDDVKGFYKSSIVRREHTTIVDNLWDFGKFKEKKWSFQKESRFVLMASPLLPLSHPLVNGDVMKQYDTIPYGLASHMDQNVECIDVAFSDSAFSNMEITLPPCINSANRIIVQALLNQYNPSAIIHESTLKLRK